MSNALKVGTETGQRNDRPPSWPALVPGEIEWDSERQNFTVCFNGELQATAMAVPTSDTNPAVVVEVPALLLEDAGCACQDFDGRITVRLSLVEVSILHDLTGEIIRRAKSGELKVVEFNATRDMPF